MKKIMLISDCKHFTATAMHFLSKLPKEGKMFMLGLFPQSRNYEALIEYASPPFMRMVVDMLEQDREIIEDNILSFTGYCKREGINCRVNKEYHPFELEMLVQESRFSDLAIMSSNLVRKQTEGRQSPVLKDMLTNSECPVLVLPENYTPPKKVIVAYDGEKQSMFALKQFYYLFPHFAALPAEIVYLNKEEMAEVPNAGSLKEYVTPNLSAVHLLSVPVHPKKEVGQWAANKTDILFLSGSYSRRNVSDMSTEHFIDPVIDLGSAPVFIAHL